MVVAKCPWHGMQKGLMRIEEDDWTNFKKSTSSPSHPPSTYRKKKKP
jgi:hypothetical protein